MLLNYLETIPLSKDKLLITTDFNIHVVINNPDSFLLNYNHP